MCHFGWTSACNCCCVITCAALVCPPYLSAQLVQYYCYRISVSSLFVCLTTAAPLLTPVGSVGPAWGAHSDEPCYWSGNSLSFHHHQCVWHTFGKWEMYLIHLYHCTDSVSWKQWQFEISFCLYPAAQKWDIERWIILKIKESENQINADNCSPECFLRTFTNLEDFSIWAAPAGLGF